MQFADCIASRGALRARGKSMKLDILLLTEAEGLSGRVICVFPEEATCAEAWKWMLAHHLYNRRTITSRCLCGNDNVIIGS